MNGLYILEFKLLLAIYSIQLSRAEKIIISIPHVNIEVFHHI
jgi:hypothetical protein